LQPIVISLATNAGWDYVRTWVLSLRSTGYAGPVALATANCDADLYEECARHQVECVEIDPAAMATRHLEDPITGRHAVLSRVIGERFAGHFVLACDARDVVFQGDPFAYFGADLTKADPSKLYVSGEGFAIGQDDSDGAKWTATKIKQLFSEREREEMRGRPTYNGGLLCGESALLAGVMRTIYLMLYNSASQIGDQAALNVLVGLEPLRSHVVAVEVEDGWAVHFAAVQWKLVPEAIRPRIEDGLVKTHDGRIYAIVHQYDRSKQLRALVEERSWEPAS
jgi:hypothetical protein